MHSVVPVVRRICADALLLSSALFFPWWVTLALGAALFMYFTAYHYELLFVAFFMDILYGFASSRFWGFPYVTLAAALLLIVALSPVRRRIRV